MQVRHGSKARVSSSAKQKSAERDTGAKPIGADRLQRARAHEAVISITGGGEIKSRNTEDEKNAEEEEEEEKQQKGKRKMKIRKETSKEEEEKGKALRWRP